MPWRETKPVCERQQFIALHQTGLFSVTELCQRFAISRKTAYKWIGRFQEQGMDALKERSRAPHTCPHKRVYRKSLKVGRFRSWNAEPTPVI